MQIAVVGGTGKQGFGLALQLARSGNQVIIGSRTIERAESAEARARRRIGPNARVDGATNDRAVREADVVFVTVPHEAQAGTYATMVPHLRPSAIVVDTTNPIAPEMKAAPGVIDSSQDESAAEHAARLLPADIRLVAGFQNVAASRLRALEMPLEGDVLLCGDDEEAKRVVGSLVEQIPDLRWIDAGSLSMARAVERLTGLLISVNRRYAISGAGVRLHGHPTWGRPPKST